MAQVEDEGRKKGRKREGRKKGRRTKDERRPGRRSKTSATALILFSTFVLSFVPRSVKGRKKGERVKGWTQFCYQCYETFLPTLFFFQNFVSFLQLYLSSPVLSSLRPFFRSSYFRPKNTVLSQVKDEGRRTKVVISVLCQGGGLLLYPVKKCFFSKMQKKYKKKRIMIWHIERNQILHHRI